MYSNSLYLPQLLKTEEQILPFTELLDSRAESGCKNITRDSEDC